MVVKVDVRVSFGAAIFPGIDRQPDILDLHRFYHRRQVEPKVFPRDVVRYIIDKHRLASASIAAREMITHFDARLVALAGRGKEALSLE